MVFTYMLSKGRAQVTSCCTRKRSVKPFHNALVLNPAIIALMCVYVFVFYMYVFMSVCNDKILHVVFMCVCVCVCVCVCCVLCMCFIYEHVLYVN